VIAAVERLQTDRARLRSLLAEVADTSIDAGPYGDALAVLSPDLLAEIREALAACPDDFGTVTELACCGEVRGADAPGHPLRPVPRDVLPEGPAL
jgi:hypothetical protein